jgi:hypothetical protein
MWEFGISEVTTWPWAFEEDITRYGALGAESIEIWEFKLANGVRKRRDQIAAARARGLAVSSFQADIHALFPTHLKREPAALEARAAIIGNLSEEDLTGAACQASREFVLTG